MRGVWGALPHHAMCQRVPLLSHDLLLIEVRRGPRGEGGECVHSPGGEAHHLSSVSNSKTLTSF